MLRALLARSTELPGAPDVRRLAATLDDWQSISSDVAATGARLLSLWTERAPAAVHAAFLCDGAALVVDLELDYGEMAYPGLADFFPAATRMQRAAADLTGVAAIDPDSRPWLRHAAWPREYKPLAPRSIDYVGDGTPPPDDYPFVRVSGDGVHEIPVGPVHAGHHRAGPLPLLDRRREGAEARGAPGLRAQGHRAAVRAHEARRGPSARGARVGRFGRRVLVGVLPGARGSGALRGARSARFGCARSRSKPSASRITSAISARSATTRGSRSVSRSSRASRSSGSARSTRRSAQRYLNDFIVPGGVARDARDDLLTRLADCARALGAEAAALRSIYDEHAGVRDRFVGAGIVAPELAARLGLIGLAGRASGQALDLRVDLPCAPYAELEPAKSGRDEGDVAARVAVRFDELAESLRLVREIVDALPRGEVWGDVPPAARARAASGSSKAGAVPCWSR